MTKGSRHFKFWLVAIFLVVLINLAIGEVVFRVHNYVHERKRPFWFPDPFLGYVHNPNNEFTYRLYEGEPDEILAHHQINSFGLLGEEIPVDKPDDTIRVVVLGDSFTEAFQVEPQENFCEQLERLLNASVHDHGKTYEVLNAGVSGYSPISELYLYQKVIKRLKPDIVIQQLFANDVHDDHKTSDMSILDEEGMPYKLTRYFMPSHYGKSVTRAQIDNETPWMDLMHQRFSDWSRFYEYLYIKSVKRFKNAPLNKEMVSQDQYKDENTVFIIERDKPVIEDPEFVQLAWGKTRKYIKALRDEVVADGAEFYLFYIPYDFQLNLKEYSSSKGYYFSGGATTYFNNLLRDFTQEEGIAFLDLLPSFDEHEKADLYLRHDRHLTPFGHEVTAKALHLTFFNSDVNSP